MNKYKAPIPHYKNMVIRKPNPLLRKFEADLDYSFNSQFWFSATMTTISLDEAYKWFDEFLGVKVNRDSIEVK